MNETNEEAFLRNSSTSSSKARIMTMGKKLRYYAKTFTNSTQDA